MGPTITDMKVDTHSRLIDAALFGLPTLGCRPPQQGNPTPPAGLPATASPQEPGVTIDPAEPPKPGAPAE